MKNIIKFFSLFLIIVLVGALGYLHSKMPKKSGVISLDSVSTPVHVYYDSFGVPHIEGESTLDVYRVLGFVTASNRLFQMDLLRRVVSGSLSEVFGETTLDADILLRTLKIKKSAKKQLEFNRSRLPKSMLLQIDAYLEGVHEFIDTQSLPVEFDLLGYKPEKFEVEDVLSISGYMALSFAEGLNGDIVLSELYEKLPKAKLDILRVGDKTDYSYFKDQKIVKSKILDQLQNGIAGIEKVFPLFSGSNSWVLSGKRSKSGYPILANDPHISTSNPHIFFEAHIKTPDLEIYGNYIPLIPFAVMGHTPHSAWAVTMAELDDMTIYQERINPENPDQVMYMGEWKDLIKESTTIRIKNKKDKTISLRETTHGPILSGTKFDVNGKALSLSWSLYLDENRAIQSLYELAYAKSLNEFEVATSHATAPGLNISWVNSRGDIAWWVLGKFPKLPDGVPYDLVLDGWSGKNEIERFYEHKENPHQMNPESGVIITANYKPQLKEFEHFDGYWQPGGRYFRIEKLLSDRAEWDIHSLKKVQLDSYVPIFDQLKEVILVKLSDFEGTKLEQKSLELLKKWNGESVKESIGSSIYHHFLFYVQENIFRDELGDDLYKRFNQTADVWHSMKALFYQDTHPFWDNIDTDRVENAKDIIVKSFKQAILRLKMERGAKLSNWRWGSFHTATYEHPLGKVKPLNFLFNIGPIEANGGRYTINNLGHKRSSSDFSVKHGPATRRIIDMKSPREALGIIPTGNSGNFLSPHYSDQAELYHQGLYRNQSMDWSLIQAGDKLTFD